MLDNYIRSIYEDIAVDMVVLSMEYIGASVESDARAQVKTLTDLQLLEYVYNI